MLDWHPDSGRRSGNLAFLSELRIQFGELPHLAIGPPTYIAVPRVPQVPARDLIEAASHVEARGDFVGDRLIVHKSVFVSRADSFFVEALSIQQAAFNTRDLCAHQCSAIFEILRAIPCPYVELPLVIRQSLEMLLSLIRRCGIPACCVRKRAIEAPLC